jgi:hypothetical protein
MEQGMYDIKKFFADQLKPLGFKKKRNRYVRLNGNIASAVYLYRSNFSDRYFVDVGVIFMPLENAEPFTRGVWWHMSTRLYNLVPDHVLFERALSLVPLYNLPLLTDSVRSAVLEDGISRVMTIFENQWEREEWLFQKAVENDDHNILIAKKLREYASGLQKKRIEGD